MLTVNSYPELFSTLLGWQQYQNLWGIITSTGLVFLPFISMIIRNTASPFMSQEAKSAYTISLRRIEFNLGVMFVVIMLACQPVMTLDPSVVHFKPVCNKAIDATPGNSGTTYDDAFPNIPSVKVPLWWYAIIGISHGITAASTVGLGCDPNLREEEIKLDLTRIESAPKRAEVQQFVKSCWVPAWRKYNEEKPDITQYTKKYGNGDPEWVGSHAFINMPGYYNALNAPEPIVGFPYDPQRDWAQGKNHGKWGTPTCRAWWTNANTGLFDQLKSQVNPTLWTKITSKFKQGNAEDAVIKQLVNRNWTDGYQNDEDMVGKYGGLGTGIEADVGLEIHSVSYFPKMYLVIESLPLVQAYLLMACYLFLAIALPASGFKMSTVLSLSFAIFSIIFWSYLWQLAIYVDSAMISALDPTGGIQFPTKSYSGTPLLDDMVAVVMYIAIPLFWTVFMGWAGISAGGGVSSLLDRTSGVATGAGGAALLGSALKSASKKIEMVEDEDEDD
jgi:hypothetical protein